MFFFLNCVLKRAHDLRNNDFELTRFSFVRQLFEAVLWQEIIPETIRHIVETINIVLSSSSQSVQLVNGSLVVFPFDLWPKLEVRSVIYRTDREDEVSTW